MEHQLTRQRPKFVLGGDSREQQQANATQKRPRLVLSRSPPSIAGRATSAAEPAAEQAAAAYTRTQPPAAPVQARVSQTPDLHANSAAGSTGSPTLAPPGRVPRPLRTRGAGGYHNRVVHVFCQEPVGTGPRKHGVGQWRRGRIADFRQEVRKQGLYEAVDMIRVVYMHEVTETTLPAEEWMDINANHDLRFELTGAAESLLDARAAPHFGGWPDSMVVTHPPINGPPTVSQTPTRIALPAGARGAPVAMGHSATAVAVATTVAVAAAAAAAGEINLTSQDATGSGQNRGNEIDDGRTSELGSHEGSDSDLDLDFLADELSAYVEKMPAQPARDAVPPSPARRPAENSADTTARGKGGPSSGGAGGWDVVDLT